MPLRNERLYVSLRYGIERYELGFLIGDISLFYNRVGFPTVRPSVCLPMRHNSLELEGKNRSKSVNKTCIIIDIILE